jgi:formyl-CoA transferase
VFRDIVGGAELLIENFQPDTFERWGLGYDALSELNEELVMLRIS